MLPRLSISTTSAIAGPEKDKNDAPCCGRPEAPTPAASTFLREQNNALPEGNHHRGRDRDGQRHHADFALSEFVDHDDGNARLVIDRATGERDVVIDLRSDGWKNPDVHG
jgi:hypothetical protein